jgi:hypothetical protein
MKAATKAATVRLLLVAKHQILQVRGIIFLFAFA